MACFSELKSFDQVVLSQCLYYIFAIHKVTLFGHDVLMCTMYSLLVIIVKNVILNDGKVY